MPENRISATLSQAGRQAILDSLGQRFARRPESAAGPAQPPDHP